MSALMTYARCAITFLEKPGSQEAAIEYTKLPGRRPAGQHPES